MSEYNALPDEDKLELAIEFVALGWPIPEPIQLFLKEHGLLSDIQSEGT